MNRGYLDVKRWVTTIPGYVRMLIDVRDVDSDRQRATARLMCNGETEQIL